MTNDVCSSWLCTKSAFSHKSLIDREFEHAILRAIDRNPRIMLTISDIIIREARMCLYQYAPYFVTDNQAFCMKLVCKVYVILRLIYEMFYYACT